MKNKKYLWLLGLIGIMAVIAIPIGVALPKAEAARDNPQAYLPQYVFHTDHTDIIKGTFATGQEVTQACLTCHPNAANEMMGTSHFKWESEPFDVPWRDEDVTIGKKNQINNFCIGTQGNEKKCMSCHVGNGWEDENFDFTEPTNVDCLACHADTSTYAKGDFGIPQPDIDLAAAAKSVRLPTRDNCGKCHFDGGGGNGVKHGDLDETLYFPSQELDVHMGGELNMQCIACHRSEEHVIKGKLLADNYTIDPKEQVACTDCHSPAPHPDDRLNSHTASVACQTCHVPALALKDPTKMTWDWSTAGQDRGEDHYTYLKIKGSFAYDKNVTPTYAWFNGNNEYRYLLGDKLDPTQPTFITKPAGSITDTRSLIAPFKVHVANQPYDTVNNILLQPRTAGEGGYWTTFDWASALELGAQDTGLDYSGQYGFTETQMYWPSTHMVQPTANALQCADCHSENGRLDWEALGYPGDPIKWGGRFSQK